MKSIALLFVGLLALGLAPAFVEAVVAGVEAIL